MKRSIHTLVALMLALTLVFAMAIAVSATETEAPAAHSHCVCGGQVLGHDHEVIEWIAWGDDEAEQNKLPSASGNYYLTADVNLAAAWDIKNVSINLCLNGRTVNGLGTYGDATKTDPQTIMMGTKDNADSANVTKLVITDCQGTGVVQSDTNQQGGALRCRKDPYASIELYAGTLNSTVVNGTKDGGAVYMDGGIFRMYGGTISGGTGTGSTGGNGGAVCLSQIAQFELHGGTIVGGTNYARGGAVMLYAGASFTMYDGLISGGSAAYGKGIYSRGTATIYGGTVDVARSNLQINSGGTIQIKEAFFPQGIQEVNGNLLSGFLMEGSVYFNNNSYTEATDSLKILSGSVVIGSMAHEDHCVCAGTQEHDCSDLQWQPWADGDSLPTTNGNYYLVGDVKLTDQWNLQTKEINLCLNGHTVTGAALTGGGDGKQLIMMGTNNNTTDVTHLAIADCQGTGVMQNESNQPGSVIRIRTDPLATLDIYGGTFRNRQESVSEKDGPVAYIYGGTFNLYDGTLIGRNTSKAGGALVIATPATANIYGGQILGAAQADKGGAVYVNGKLNIFGGKITGSDQSVAIDGGAVAANTNGQIVQRGGTVTGATGDGATQKNGGAIALFGNAKYELYDGTVIGGTGYYRGGAVAVREADAVFNMYGGTIQGGAATYGNAIHNNNGTVYIDGGVIDTPNTGYGNLHLNSGSLVIKTASFPQGIKITSNNTSYDVLKELLEAGSYMTANGSYVMGTGQAANGDVKILVSDHAHCVCNGTVADHACDNVGWMAWTNETALPTANGYYYLTVDVDLTGQWEIKNKNISLCLNGHTVTGAGGTAQTIMLGSTTEDETIVSKLAITDCNETAGKIVSDSNQNGAIIRARAYGNITVNLYNGTLDATCEAATNEGGAVALNSGTFNMYGGTLDGFATTLNGTVNKNGGTVAVNKGEFNLYGGTITGGKVSGVIANDKKEIIDGSKGGNVIVNGGAFNMYGGTITGGTAEYFGGNIFIKSGSFNLYDGIISDGTATHANASYAGNIFMESGTFTMNGGTVTGGSAVMGGGNMYMVGGTFTLNDGTITAGKVTGTARMGGNLWVSGSTAKADLIGGTISAGEAAHGGNLRLTNGGTMNLKGTTVTGGIVKSNGGNLSMTGGTFNMTGGELTSGKAASGGNAYVNGGTFNATGGTISGGQASNMGGNIYFQKDGYLGAVTINGGKAGTKGGSLTVQSGATVIIDGATISNVNDAAYVAQQGGAIYSEGTLSISNATISGGYVSSGNRSGGTIAIGGGEATIEDSVLNAGYGNRGTCVNVHNDGKLKVTNSVINGRPEVLPAAKTLGTCCWIEDDAVFTLVGDVKITGEGLDVVHDIREGGAYTDISELAIVADENGNVEKISVKNQTNGVGQVIYAGTNADAINMVEAFWNTYQSVSYNDQSGWIEIVMSSLVGYDADGNVYGFDTWEDAMAESIVRVVVYSPVSGAITKNIVLDLNGISLTDMIIADGVYVELIDSATNDYKGAYGTLTLTSGSVEQGTMVYGDRTYLVVCEEGVYSAHCYEVKLTHVSLDAANDALGYKAELLGDEVILEQVEQFGFRLWVDGGQVKTYATTGKQVLTLRLKNIMAAGGGEMGINANAFVTFKMDGGKTSADHRTTMKDTILAVNAAWDSYSDSQKAAVKALYSDYSEVMDTWFAEDVTNNIKTWAPVVDDNTDTEV